MRVLLALVTLVACATKGPEAGAPLDGAFGSFDAPTDHGEVTFGAIQTATFTPDNEAHTWTFSVTETVAIRAFTDLVPKHSGVDTVLYLYKKSQDGWGSYIARDDDDGRLEWSSIEGSLGAGDYRVLVKGYSSSEHGGFELEVDCTGTGCAQSTNCLFGASAAAIMAIDQLAVTTAAFTSPVGIDELDRGRVVLALHESIHTDVATIDDAFAAADDHTIQLIDLYDRGGERGFTAVEYAAGGNTYGAIFAGATSERVAAIHDDTIVSCTAAPATCPTGHGYQTARDHGCSVFE
jgi:hypothetical protein